LQVCRILLVKLQPKRINTATMGGEAQPGALSDLDPSRILDEEIVGLGELVLAGQGGGLPFLAEVGRMDAYPGQFEVDSPQDVPMAEGEVIVDSRGVTVPPAGATVAAVNSPARGTVWRRGPVQEVEAVAPSRWVPVFPSHQYEPPLPFMPMIEDTVSVYGYRRVRFDSPPGRSHEAIKAIKKKLETAKRAATLPLYEDSLTKLGSELFRGEETRRSRSLMRVPAKVQRFAGASQLVDRHLVPEAWVLLRYNHAVHPLTLVDAIT
jgi:hypothetical protein